MAIENRRGHGRRQAARRLLSDRLGPQKDADQVRGSGPGCTETERGNTERNREKETNLKNEDLRNT